MSIISHWYFNKTEKYYFKKMMAYTLWEERNLNPFTRCTWTTNTEDSRPEKPPRQSRHLLIQIHWAKWHAYKPIGHRYLKTNQKANSVLQLQKISINPPKILAFSPWLITTWWWNFTLSKKQEHRFIQIKENFQARMRSPWREKKKKKVREKKNNRP